MEDKKKGAVIMTLDGKVVPEKSLNFFSHWTIFSGKLIPNNIMNSLYVDKKNCVWEK